MLKRRLIREPNVGDINVPIKKIKRTSAEHQKTIKSAAR